jgi:hypothetical protein
MWMRMRMGQPAERRVGRAGGVGRLVHMNQSNTHIFAVRWYYMTNVAEKQMALRLRKLGHSYSYIQEQTGVAKSTLSVWLSTVPYHPNQETIRRIGIARARSGEVKSRLKRESLLAAAQQARSDIRSISDRDLFMLGIGLYIGEGTKTYGSVRIMNADTKVIKLAIVWFMRSCGLKKDNFSIRLHLYPDNDVDACIDHWAHATGLSRAQFRKTSIDRRTGKKLSKRGKLPYGTAHLSVKSNGKKEHGVYLARRISAWMSEAIRSAGIV